MSDDTVPLDRAALVSALSRALHQPGNSNVTGYDVAVALLAEIDHVAARVSALESQMDGILIPEANP